MAEVESRDPRVMREGIPIRSGTDACDYIISVIYIMLCIRFVDDCINISGLNNGALRTRTVVPISFAVSKNITITANSNWHSNLIVRSRL